MFRLQSRGTSGEESDADYGEAHVGDIVMDADRLLQTRNEGVVLRNGKKHRRVRARLITLVMRQVCATHWIQPERTTLHFNTGAARRVERGRLGHGNGEVVIFGRDDGLVQVVVDGTGQNHAVAEVETGARS